MTAEEEFEKTWTERTPNYEGIEKIIARRFYLAATKATAARCVEICMTRYTFGEDCARAIKEEYDLE